MLTHYVVLAFFGEDNWGKLTNLSESGMAIEFARRLVEPLQGSVWSRYK